MMVWLAAAWAGVCGSGEPVGQLGELVDARLVAVERDRVRHAAQPGMALCGGDRVRTWYGAEVVVHLYDPIYAGVADEDLRYEHSLVGRLRENADVEVFSCGVIQYGGLAGYAFPESLGCMGEIRLGTSGYYLTRPASQVMVDMGGDDPLSERPTCLTGMPVVGVGEGWVSQGEAGHRVVLVSGDGSEVEIDGGEVVQVARVPVEVPERREELLAAAIEDEHLVATRQLDRRERLQGLVVRVPDGVEFEGFAAGGAEFRGFVEVSEGTWWLRSQGAAERLERLRAAGEKVELVTGRGRVEVQDGVGKVLVVDPPEEGASGGGEEAPGERAEGTGPVDEPVVRVREATALRPAMVRIEAGRFLMGSPVSEVGRDGDETLHEVVIPRPFEMGATEVTQAQYVAVMGDNPSTPEWDGVSLLGEDLPVQNVTWLQAVEFCNRLSAQEGLRPAYSVAGGDVTWDRDADGYRLPTEAEWEYAARAGSSLAYGMVAEEKEVCGVGNVADRSAKERFSWVIEFDCSDGYAGLAPVARFAANPWGLYDVVGNVREWAWDRYQADISATGVDGGGPSGGLPRVYRGGSFLGLPWFVRVANRDWVDPSNRSDILGFRLARSLPSAL